MLTTLFDALREERPELLVLARERLLPVLVACREPLSVEELVWATGAAQAKHVRMMLLVHGFLIGACPTCPAYAADH